MPKINGKYKKKPYIPNYNPNAMTREQRLAFREVVHQAQNRAAVTGNFNLRKSQ